MRENTKDCTSVSKVVLKLGSTDPGRFTKVFQSDPGEIRIWCLIYQSVLKMITVISSYDDLGHYSNMRYMGTGGDVPICINGTDFKSNDTKSRALNKDTGSVIIFHVI